MAMMYLTLIEPVTSKKERKGLSIFRRSINSKLQLKTPTLTSSVGRRKATPTISQSKNSRLSDVGIDSNRESYTRTMANLTCTTEKYNSVEYDTLQSLKFLNLYEKPDIKVEPLTAEISTKSKTSSESVTKFASRSTKINIRYLKSNQKETKDLYLKPEVSMLDMVRNKGRRVSNTNQDTRKLEKQDVCYQYTEVEENTSQNTSLKELIMSKESVRIPDHNQDKKQLLPPKTKVFNKMKTLVLDLDETLVHAKFTEKVEGVPDHFFQIKINNSTLPVHLWIRPGAQDFIKEMSKYYELVVFTASRAIYADKVLDLIDPENLISHRLYRNSCSEHAFVDEKGKKTTFYVKDLSRLSRYIDDMIILDNSPSAYIYQKENGMPIKSWTGQANDDELYQYINVLKMVAKFEIDLKYTLLNIVKDDLTIDHDKFAEIVNSAICKPNYAQKTKDYRRAHYSRSHSKGRKSFGLDSDGGDLFKTCCIQTDLDLKEYDFDTDSKDSDRDSNFLSPHVPPKIKCSSIVLNKFENLTMQDCKRNPISGSRLKKSIFRKAKSHYEASAISHL